MVENTVVLRPPRTGRTCIFGHVMDVFVERWLGIRTCFSNRVYVLVGDTDMFSPPAGGVCGAYAIRPYTRYMPYMKIRLCFPNRVHIWVRDTDMFFEPGICFGWGYGYIFATCGWRLWGVCNTPLHVLHAVHQNTAMFFEPGTYFGWEYGHVFRTGHTLSIEIRTCFPNRIHVTHQNAETFSELGTNDPSKYGRVFRIR